MAAGPEGYTFIKYIRQLLKTLPSRTSTVTESAGRSLNMSLCATARFMVVPTAGCTPAPDLLSLSLKGTTVIIMTVTDSSYAGELRMVLSEITTFITMASTEYVQVIRILICYTPVIISMKTDQMEFNFEVS